MKVFLIRHGETVWSLTGQHTGHTDISLTEHGESQARHLGELLQTIPFAHVLTSPLQRARRTCELAGFGAVSRVEPNLGEWDYGDYEGLTTPEIQKSAPGWTIFTGAVPNGETAAQVAARADRVISRATAAGGDVALFGHGHLLRILAARWIGLEPAGGRLLALSTASLSVLGYERETRVIRLWNQTSS
jgi:probable phosphoglycerate mutase